ncbi:MAG TPA: GNAT family protein [Phycisphaerales bacterium]|nr:GNAT family protein [Phycisphaerales bacterium]
MTADGELRTQRLRIVPATVNVLKAELECGVTGLGDALRVRVADGWPAEHWDAGAIGYTIRKLTERPEESGWWAWYVMKSSHEAVGQDVLIGTCGYKGLPDEKGIVEIGYGIVEAERRKGFASEASRALIERAFAWKDSRGVSVVRSVMAETLPELIASIGVMKKAGMSFEGEGSEPGTVRYRVTREAWISSAP